MLEIAHLADKQTVIQEARRDLVAYLAECRHAARPVLLCLSGGSVLPLATTAFDASVLGSHVTVTVLDERYTTDGLVSNYAQLSMAGFIDTALGAGCAVIDTRVQTDPLETRAALAA
jgi:6-phosphogluconolactonase/glucosamine-6-phosphate isomerase/deaminase